MYVSICVHIHIYVCIYIYDLYRGNLNPRKLTLTLTLAVRLLLNGVRLRRLPLDDGLYTHICLCIYICAFMYVYICVYLYIYIYIESPSLAVRLLLNGVCLRRLPLDDGRGRDDEVDGGGRGHGAAAGWDGRRRRADHPDGHPRLRGRPRHYGFQGISIDRSIYIHIYAHVYRYVDIHI